MSGLHFDITADNTNLMRKLQETEQGIKNTSSQIEREGGSIENLFSRMTKAAAAFGAGFTAKELINQVIKVRGEFQQLEVAFTTMLGSEEKATALMSQLTETAAKTPFDLQGVANGARQLLAYGTAAEDVNGTLIRLGNIAAGLSIPLNDLVYLYGTTMTQGRLYTEDLNQFTGRGIPMIKELAKEFGVAESEIRSMVEAGKIGFPEVQKVINNLTNEGGMFFNLMQEQSKTITGQISNIGDSFSMMLNDIGQANEGIINEALGGVSYLIENYEEVGKILLEIVGTYGAYRAALMTITALQSLQAAGVTALTAKEAIHYSWLVLTQKAQLALNKTMLANPYVAAAAAVAALGLGIYKLATYQTEAEKAQARLNEANQEYEKSLAAEQIQIDELFGRLNAATKGTQEWNDAKDAIMSRYGEYLKDLGDESTALNNVALAYHTVSMAAEQAAKSRAMNNFMTQEADKLAEARAEALTNIRDELNEAFGDEKGAGGLPLADTYFWRIKPVIEGKEYVHQIDDIKKALYDAGVSNEVYQNINKAVAAANQYKTSIEDARKIWGDAPKQSSEAAEPFSTEGKSISQLEEEIKKAQTALEGLKKSFADGSGTQEAITQQEAYIKSLQDTVLEREKDLKVISQVEAQISKLKKEQKETEYGSKEYNSLQARIDALDAKLPQTKTEQRAEETAAKKQKEAQEKLAKELLELQQKNQQAETDLMEEGTAKKLKQIDDYYEAQKKEIEKKSKELAELNKKAGVTDVNESDLTAGQQSAIDEANRLNESIRLRSIKEIEKEEKAAMNAYLAEYGTYQQKRLAITQEYEQKIAKATTQGEKLTLGKQMEEALADLDIEALKTTSAISQLFGDMTDKTLKEMERINEEGSAALEFLKGGQWDEQKGIRFGIDKEQFDTLSQSPEKLKAISDALEQNRKAAEQLRPAYEKVAEGLLDLFNAGSDSKKLTQALADIQEGLNECLQAASFLSDAFAGLGDAFGSNALGSIAEGINIAVDSLNSAMKGMQSGAQIGSMFGGVGGAVGSAVGGAVGLFTGIANAIARIHDKKNERRIQRLQDQIDVLTDSYSELGRAVEDAYSKDASGLIEDQNKLLEQQKVLIQQQIKEEEDKKKTDNDRIDEWKQQLEEIDQAIADNKEKAVDAIFGEDLQSAIENFAAAYTEAWASGEDRAESAKDFVRDMMRSMVTESIKGALESSKAIESIRKMMKKFYEDDYLSTLEKALLETAVTNLANNLDEEFGWAADLFKDEEEGTTAEEEHEKQIEELQKAYDQLSDAVSRAYSTDKVKALSQQEENLRQQIEATRKAMDEESSANGTGTEWYGELQDQYQELSQQLSDLKEQKIDAIFGEDIQSAIESFVSAYTEALSQGDTSQVSKDFVEGMVQSMVTESMKMDASPVMEQVRQKLVEAWQDGVVTAEEQADVEAVIDRLNQQLKDKYQWAESLFGEDTERTSEIEGLEGMKDAYDRLSESIGQAYSSEKARLLKEQNDLLQQQKALLEQTIAAEQALGDEANQDFIDEWENQLEEVNQQIQDNKEAQLDAIFGQDTQSAISNLADALIDAWSSGEDRAKTSKEFVNSLIRSMAAEAMKMDISPVMEQLRDQLGGMFADGIISADEGSVIQGMVDGLASKLEEQYSWLDQFLEQAEDKAEEVQETFSGITFDSMRDNFVSQLSDMSTSYEDMCADMEDQLRQSILQGFLKSKYQGAIQSLLNTWDMYGASGGNIDPDEIEALRQQYKELISAMIQDREDLAQQFGWEQFRQEASRGSYEIASQESVDEQNGRLTAMYESDLRREQLLSSILSVLISGSTGGTSVVYESNYVGDLSGMSDFVNGLLSMSIYSDESNRTLSEIKNLIIAGNGYLYDISENVKRMYNTFGSKLDMMNNNLKNAL